MNQKQDPHMKSGTRASPVHTLPRPCGLPSYLAMIGCRELFAELPIDAALARRAVPSGYSIKHLPTNQAKLLFLIQDCQRGVLDGVLLVRPLKMAQLWIELEGPEEVGPALPGTTSSLPTSYWYALPHQIDSVVACTAFRVAGIDVQRVVRIEPGSAAGAPRQGEVVEDRSADKRYVWEETTRLWAAPNVVTGRRWFYRDYGRVLKRRSVGLVVCRAAFLGEGEITVTASPNSAIGRLGLVSLHGVSNAVEMDCKAKIRVGRP